MNDTHILKSFNALVDELNQTQGTNAKIEILREHDDLRPLIKRIWDTSKTHVTKSTLEKWKKRKDESSVDIMDVLKGTTVPATLYELFDALTSSKLTGDRARAAVWAYVARHPTYEDLILRIMEKNPRIRLGATTLLQAFPGIFTIFKVCLSQEWTQADFAKAYAAADNQAWISKKIDGMRVITQITAPQDGALATVRFYSRKGHEVTSLDVLRRDILRHLVPHMDAEEIAEGRVLDGEIVALDDRGNEDFKLTISNARKKDATWDNPRYRLFDYMPLAVFEERARGERFGERLEQLRDFKDVMPRRCEILEQTPYTAEAFEALCESARRGGWEGLMIRMDALYEAKRTRNLLKWKLFQTDEFRVEQLIIDDAYPFPNRTGGEERMPALAAVVIHHKGDPVQVGSGFDKAERLEFAMHPDRIRGRMIAVKYQEEFQDAKTKRWSLRCPIYQGVVGDQERDM